MKEDKTIVFALNNMKAHVVNHRLVGKILHLRGAKAPGHKLRKNISIIIVASMTDEVV